MSVQKTLAEFAASDHVQSRARRLKLDLTWSQLDLPAPEPPINLKHAFCSAQSELEGRRVFVPEIRSNLLGKSGRNIARAIREIVAIALNILNLSYLYLNCL